MSVRESFALKSGVENFAGGSVGYGPEGQLIDLSPLVVPGAVITVTTEIQASVLRQVEVLKSAPTPDEHSLDNAPQEDLDENEVLSTVSQEEAEEEQKRLLKEGPAPPEEEKKPSGSAQGSSGGSQSPPSGTTTPATPPAPTGAPGQGGQSSQGGDR